MFARKKFSENVDPLKRGVGPKKGITDGPVKAGPTKLKKPTLGQTRRAAFGDITNATKEQTGDDTKKKQTTGLKPSAKNSTNITGNNRVKPLAKKKTETKKKNDSHVRSSQNSSASSDVSSSSSVLDQLTSSQESTVSNNEQALKNLAAGVPIDRVEEDFSFVIVEDSDAEDGTSDNADSEETSLLSFDLENYTDVFNVGIYAQDIFEYYKRREKMFLVPAYLDGKGHHITPSMRSILVDWMVEIQENFELNHETLYLAVKLTDVYLSRVIVDKEMLQLVGAASVFIASKFDRNFRSRKNKQERCPPLIEDFTYICDNAFNRDQFILMEMEVLRKVDFDLGIPISYRFLRRYSKVARMSMETLTLARYILEMSLMEYELVVERDSKTAAAALYIAQKMKKEGAWEGELVKASGYTVEDFKDVVVKLNKMLLARPIPQLSTIRSKYSHIVFHEVAKIPPLPLDMIL